MDIKLKIRHMNSLNLENWPGNFGESKGGRNVLPLPTSAVPADNLCETRVNPRAAGPLDFPSPDGGY